MGCRGSARWKGLCFCIVPMRLHQMYFLRDSLVLLRGYLGVRDALIQYLWKQSIVEVMCFESPQTYEVDQVQDNKII